MSQINLKQITGTGFLTFYNAFDFYISNYGGKTLQIDGQNLDDEMSKSNGSGKSSLLEAIGWGLYGELCRKNRYKDEVIYNRNGVKAKQAVLLVDFEDRGGLYRIERKIEWKKGPELCLWNNDEEILRGSTYAVKQEHLEKILGMNFIAFQCCEMFGRDFMSFPDLKSAERAKVLTDIRGLEKYVLASKECGGQVKDRLTVISGRTEELRVMEGRVSQLRETNYKDKIKEFEETRKKDIEDLQTLETTTKNLLKEVEKEQKEKIQKLEEQIKEYEKDKKKNEELLTKLPTFEKEKEDVEKTLSQLSTNNEILRQKLKEIIQESTNFQKLKIGNCPICKQKITGEHLKKEINILIQKAQEINSQMEELNPKILEVLKQIGIIKTNIEHLKAVDIKNREVINTIYNTKNTILTLQRSPEAQRHINTLEGLKDRLKALRNTQNPYEKQEEERKITLFGLVEQIKRKKQGIESLNEEIQYYQFWVEGFKKIRISLFSIMIDRFQDYAQNLLSQYSSELQIQFSTERETRSGTTKDEFDISITDSSGTVLSYEMYSGGEKQKIRLSIAMALAQMIKDDCGKEFNFVAFDEPNDALDDMGKEVNFEVFTKLAEEGKAILVTDHDSLFKDKFDHSITVVKENDKSYIKEG